LLAACSDDGGGDDDDGLPRIESAHEPTCAGYAARLRACDVMTGGTFSCQEPEDVVDQCLLECLTTASCSLLWKYRCVDTPPALARCLARCEYFQSDENYLIPFSWICDRAPDCADGSDEVDCEFFECTVSGEEVPLGDLCDAEPDCIDGSDEDGCPTFTCSDGRVIPEQWVCDFGPDCADGADEIGCHRFVCEVNGEELPAEWRCDLDDDCLDGADEIGCAQLLCR
jgi:hypothetical protein